MKLLINIKIMLMIVSTVFVNISALIFKRSLSHKETVRRRWEKRRSPG